MGISLETVVVISLFIGVAANIALALQSALNISNAARLLQEVSATSELLEEALQLHHDGSTAKALELIRSRT